MSTIKAFTTIEQSRKLAEILPLESSDMVYLRCDFEDEGKYSILVGSYHEGYTEREDGTIVPVFDEHVPAWSLAALFAVLPNKIVSHETAFEGEDAEGINDIYNKRIEPTEDGRYTCCYVGNGCIYESVADNPVDACCEMIIKLSELKML